MKKTIDKYAKIFAKGLKKYGFSETDTKNAKYRCRLEEMYSSDAFREHNIYPMIDTKMVYAVIAMCLELREYKPEISVDEAVEFANFAFGARRKFFDILGKCVDVLPNSFQIAKKWNASDYEKRAKDGSVTCDYFNVTDEKFEYKISKCMYVEMFKHYGVREFCKIFCQTDEHVYSCLTKHVRFIRHSDLSDGDCCYDEVIKKRK
ncbi:MAG: L-2-amino-thiazoline-4-carboxylic acid hydrolase [Bacteroides sp.]|nr:L-2-amino-thiazoline-4-carboxylic acid hydrolase [Eubacterium sp.]MCM1419218.1 L-2-amino-thiazoline-4-carboxylic acid hydrolase [Roseburia sp.]MCM1463511.1 L-2-amino-thiazoline-4-carboxylic acid hydrolase [Bacteroides sp.]